MNLHPCPTNAICTMSSTSSLCPTAAKAFNSVICTMRLSSKCQVCSPCSETEFFYRVLQDITSLSLRFPPRDPHSGRGLNQMSWVTLTTRHSFTGAMELPHFDYPFRELILLLGVDNLLQLFTSVLFENQVLLCASGQ